MDLKNILNSHNRFRSESLNLLPSENRMSKLALAYLSSDMGQRYFFKTPFETGNGISYTYAGTKYIEQIVDYGEELAKDMFHAKYVSLYPISGHQANLAVLLAYCKPGDAIVVFDTQYGGYPGLDEHKLPKYLNINVHYMPTLKGQHELLDYDACRLLVEKVRPKLVIYSSAHTLFPVNIKELTSIAHDSDALFVYDGSHPLGLIAGGRFQSPLSEGADIFIAGTQKSFPGPQGGLIATNTQAKPLEEVNHFVIVDNPHFHRIAALTATLSEMTLYGEAYANQVVKNTKRLALELFNAGVEVKYSEKGFSESHMFKLVLNDAFVKMTSLLSNANIMIDAAGRIGTAEVTRLGMKEDEMKSIAHFILSALQQQDVKKQVKEFVSNFSEVQYC